MVKNTKFCKHFNFWTSEDFLIEFFAADLLNPFNFELETVESIEKDQSMRKL